MALLASGGAGGGSFAYGSLIEKRSLDFNRVDVPLQKEHAHLHGLKIALMADFHHDDFGDDNLIRRAVKQINDEHVDIVMLAGDYITDDIQGINPLCEVLRDLRPRLGVFAVLGNHDVWHYNQSLVKLMEKAGVRLLVNRGVDFDGFSVAGYDSVWAGRPDAGKTLKTISKENPVILGWHEPDTFATYNDPRIALQLSGHTHGGQVCAPLIGPLLLPEYGRKFPAGLYHREGRSLYVTRGIGTMNIPIRFLCPPEVAVLTMTDITRST